MQRDWYINGRLIMTLNKQLFVQNKTPNGDNKYHRMSGQTLYVKDFNDLISCHLCRGYLIDATTLVECLHSFCKTCILEHLDSNAPKSRFCPRCDLQIHKTKPKLNIRSDPTLQDIVYKLVPGLYKNEMVRRKEFYSKEPETEVIGLSNEERGEMSGERLILTPEDSIYLSIEYFPHYISHSLLPFSKNLANGALNSVPAPNGTLSASDSQRRYLKCEGGMRVVHLKKWLKLKYDIRDHNDIEILYKHDPLLDDYTMIDLAYIYSWRRNGPLCLYYKIIEPKKSAKSDAIFRAPTLLPKRRHKLKGKLKNNSKKRKFIDESNLITTNPVNEPLVPVDSSLINRVVASNTIGANIELMTTAVNNALTKTAKQLKNKSINKKTKRLKTQSNDANNVKPVPKKADLNPVTTGATTVAKNKPKDKSKSNKIWTEMNGSVNKSSVNNSITDSIGNGLKKSINKQINGMLGAVNNTCSSIEAINKVVNDSNNDVMNLNSSEMKTKTNNHKSSQSLHKKSKNKSSIVSQMDSNSVKNSVKTIVSINANTDKTINNTDISNHLIIPTPNGMSTLTNTAVVQPLLNNIKPTNGIVSKGHPKSASNVNKIVKSKPKTSLNSKKSINFVTNDKISITPVPAPKTSTNNIRKNPSFKSIVNQNKTQMSNNSFDNYEALKQMQETLLTAPIDPITVAFMASMMGSSPVDFFRFQNSSQNMSKSIEKVNQSKMFANNNDNKNSDNNCTDVEVALNLSTSKDKTT